MKKYKNLEKIRKSKKISQVDIAKKLGVSTQYVWYLEDGRKRLSYRQAYKIGKIVGEKPDDIFLEDAKR